MMRRKRTRASVFYGFASLLLVACTADAAGSQSALAAPATTKQHAQGYRISGRVVDVRSGAAVPRCVVEITDVKQERQVSTLLTDEDGRFSFEEVPVSKYRLSASKRGFLTQAYEEHDNYSTAIAVGPGLVSEDLLFKLTPGAIVSGTVVDDAGEPVRQAQIKLFRDQDAEGVLSTQQQSWAMTDDRGFYEITAIGPGAYFLSAAAHPWYAMQQHAGHGQDNVALDVAYPTEFYPDVTDADAATPIPVKGGERMQADFVLHAEHAVHLRIPMSEAEMRNGYGISVTHTVFGEPEDQPISMTPNGSGVVEVDGLLPGHYDIAVTKNIDGHQTSTHFSADATDGSTEVSGTENAADVTITGKVISSEGKLPPNVGIALLATHTRRAYFGSLDEAGEFSVSVPPGTYEVVGRINHNYLAALSATGATLVGHMLTVKAGAEPRLQVSVGNSVGQIDGAVMHDGHPASAAMVLLVPDHPGENRVLFRRDQSDSDGTFTLSGIVPGHYRLIAIERGWELAWADPRVLAVFLTKSRTVDVRGNDHLQGTIELQTR